MDIKEFCDALTAARQYVYQTHLLARNQGYALHTLTNDIYEHLDQHIDRLKELTISVYKEESIALAKNSLADALSLCANIPNVDSTDVQTMVKNCIALLDSLGEMLEDLTEVVSGEKRIFKQGMLNALGDISEKLAHDKYFLQMEIVL